MYIFCLPRPLFDDPVSFVLQDRNGELLGAHIAADGQWRFPAGDSVPEKFIRALVEFEDHRFFYHPGVDPLALARAVGQNIRKGSIVSGGSTLSMQVIRLVRKGKARTVGEKMIEMVLATRLEWRYRKRTILALYAAHAPFGGNIVGLEAASWRYFGKSPHLLSWSEAAVLAVLPNSPALIHPGKNRKLLLQKRNRLLERLFNRGVIDLLTLELAREEPLPEAPYPLPRFAPHLLQSAKQEMIQAGKMNKSRIKSTLDLRLQQQVTGILERHQKVLRHNEVHNLAAVILDVQANEVLAYAGNIIGAGAEHGEEVDVVKAPRSTGSILKPLLYALMLQEGSILPQSLVPDIPTIINGFRPENFHKGYDGAVSARQALIRSLNIPMVYLLQQYGLEKFHFKLRQLGFSTINQPPDHYGLTLVLGGAEGTLWDITNCYAAIARSLDHYYLYNGRYDPLDFQPSTYLHGKEKLKGELRQEAPFISAGAAWFMVEAMQELERPNSEGQWEYFQSTQPVAWKTGTSFGSRDAWAVGITPRYAVGVWVGNADGEGRPGLTGVAAAGPVLFDLFELLPSSTRFSPPYDDMARIPVCRQSGYRPLPICPVDTIRGPASGFNAAACPYHQVVSLDPEGRWQVNSDCESPSQMNSQSWFVLPPVEAHYYQSIHPDYRELPPFRPDCTSSEQIAPVAMQLIYPKNPTKIYVPVDLDGRLSRTVFSIAHRNPATVVYWHIDKEYIGNTMTFHQMELNPPEGKHVLTLVDETGNRLEQPFEIVGKQKE